MRFLLANGQVALLLLALVGSATWALADDGDEIFTEPPEPEVLSRILYGPKYRSAAIDQAPGRFGMMINFEYDSDKITPRSLPLLDSVGQMLGMESAANEVIVIEGHADAHGPATYNQGLSERRADAVKRYLVGTFGIPAELLVTVGEGEAKPHVQEDPYAAMNRRVVFRTSRSIIVQ